MSALQMKTVSFAYGSTPVLDGIDVSVAEGELVSLLGPSGSGKTTLLRLVAGLERPTAGVIRWHGQDIEGPGLGRGVVFQDYSLFPWMTVGENVEVAVRKAHPDLDRTRRRALAEEYLGMVGLGAVVSRHPHELSGGMRQRGAIARAFAMGSPLLLLDEPFGALDPVNRARLQDLLATIWRSSAPRKTVLLVTHDIDEALLLGDRVVVLGTCPGRVIADLPVPFSHPRNRREVFGSRRYVELEEQIADLYRRDVIQQIDGQERLAAGAGI